MKTVAVDVVATFVLTVPDEAPPEEIAAALSERWVKFTPRKYFRGRSPDQIGVYADALYIGECDADSVNMTP